MLCVVHTKFKDFANLDKLKELMLGHFCSGASTCDNVDESIEEASSPNRARTGGQVLRVRSGSSSEGNEKGEIDDL